ncbi:MAG: hypothetical protein OXJ55_21285 [Caldilineaceae bacterium]|nr:hypothetical protein [Caldilineaceae bacterium]MDE0624374.1 hypothetical protein [Bryobacterales bacterium]
MEKELKAQNAWPLTAMYVCTLLLVAVVHWGVDEVFEFSLKLGEQVLVVAAITAFGGVLSNLLPNRLKHPLVYWRVRNVMSGHRCRRICGKDPRLLSDDLERKWPKLFLDEMKEYEQNAYWYKEIYRPVRNAPEVLQAHRSFLLFRDAAAGLFLLLVGIVLWNVVGEAAPVQPVSIGAAVIVAGMFVFVSQAARQSGDRMVANAVVVALGGLRRY